MSTRARAYLLALIPLAVSAAVAIPVVLRMVEGVREMHRLVVPGTSDLALEPGSYVGYGETQSIVDGVAYSVPSVSVSCRLGDAATGTPIKLEAPTGSTSYSMGGFAGRSIFAFSIGTAGTYRLDCKSDGPPATVAVGTGIGSSIALLLVVLFLGMAISGTIVFVVRRRRRRTALPGA